MKALRDILLETETARRDFEQSDMESVQNELLPQFAQKLEGMGLVVHQRLAPPGTKGVAFSLANGNVLKVTLDKTEAYATKHIEGKKLKNVYQVFEVFKFGKTDFYGVHEEKCLPLKPGNESYWLRNGLPELDFRGYVNGRVTNVDERISAFLKRALSASTKGFDTELVRKGLQDVVAGVDQLADNGIKFYDVHSGNIMRRGNDLVLIDIGQAQTGPANIDDI
jgi:hypothetical protein